MSSSVAVASVAAADEAADEAPLPCPAEPDVAQPRSSASPTQAHGSIRGAVRSACMTQSIAARTWLRGTQARALTDGVSR